MTDELDPHAAYHIALSDTERETIQRTAFNFHQHTGRNMKMPPALYADLKRGGVDMRYIDPDPALEN